MKHQRIVPPALPDDEFKFYRDYEREREINRRLYELLDKALYLLDGQAGRLERATGEDLSATREFVANARKEALA